MGRGTGREEEEEEEGNKEQIELFFATCELGRIGNVSVIFRLIEHCT